MQCDNCGKEVIVNEFGNIKPDGVWPNAYGFIFCGFDPTQKDISQETCQEIFERKLWEKAQADKQAEHKTESAAPEASGDQAEMVERGTVSR